MGDISGLLVLASLSGQYFFLLIFKCDLKKNICSTAVLMNFHALFFLFVLKSIFNTYFKIYFLLSYCP